MVGEGHSVGVATDIRIDLLGASKRLFRIEHPFLTSEFLEKAMESRWLFQVFRGSPEEEFAVVESPVQGIEKLASDNLGEGFDGEEKVVF